MEGQIRNVGLRPMRLGDLSQGRLVDTVGNLWFALIFGQGMGAAACLQSADALTSKGAADVAWLSSPAISPSSGARVPQPSLCYNRYRRK